MKSLICHQGRHSIRFYETAKGKLCRAEKLSYEFQPPSYHSMSYYSGFPCKNCQISDEEIVLGDGKGNLHVKNLYTKSELKLEKHREKCEKVTCTDSIQNRLFLSGDGGYDRNKCICLWDVETKKLITKFEQPHKHEAVSSVLFLWDNLFSSGGRDCKVKMFDFVKEKEIASFIRPRWIESNYNYITDLSCFKAKNLLFSSGVDNYIYVYDTKNQKEIDSITDKLSPSEGLYSILSINHILLAGDLNGYLYRYDIRNLKDRVYKKRIHHDTINRIIENVDNLSIITGSSDKSIKIVRISNAKEWVEIQEDCEVFGPFLVNQGEKSTKNEEMDLNIRFQFLHKQRWYNFKIIIKPTNQMLLVCKFLI